MVEEFGGTGWDPQGFCSIQRSEMVMKILAVWKWTWMLASPGGTGGIEVHTYVENLI